MAVSSTTTITDGEQSDAISPNRLQWMSQRTLVVGGNNG